MPDGLWILIAFIVAVVIYTASVVLRLMRQSDEQWQQVDKSKLQEWDDDEEEW